jgi:hypothetical protein
MKKKTTDCRTRHEQVTKISATKNLPHSAEGLAVEVPPVEDHGTPCCLSKTPVTYTLQSTEY